MPRKRDPELHSRIPSVEDYLAYDGRHCAELWATLAHDWRCPACGRNKLELLRWARVDQDKPTERYGWFAAVHQHHDHGQPWGAPAARFQPTVLCDQCNVAEATAKRVLRLEPAFSFSPAEIAQFVRAVAHGRHTLDYDRAAGIAFELGVL